MQKVKYLALFLVVLAATANIAAAQRAAPSGPRFDVFVTGFDVQNDSSNAAAALGNFYKLPTKDFFVKLADLSKTEEVSEVVRHFLSCQNGQNCQNEGGTQIPVILDQGNQAGSGHLAFINPGYSFRVKPMTMPGTSDSFSLSLDFEDNEVDKELMMKNPVGDAGIPPIIKRQVKSDFIINAGETKIFGGFASKDGVSLRYYAVSVKTEYFPGK